MPPKHEQQPGTHPVGDQPPAKPEATDDKPKLFAGKYKSPEEMETAYTDLESKFGTQGEEIGNLRGQVGDLTNKLLGLVENLGARGEGTTPEAGAGEESADFDAEFEDVQAKVTSGDMSIGEALAKTREISTKEAMTQAQEAMVNMNAERDAESAKDQFLTDNPDYEEVAQSGALDDILQQNPMFDTFTAFYVYKAQQAQADRETAVNEAYEKGKAEQAKAEEGVKGTQQVLDQAGTEIAQTNKKKGPVTDSQMEDSMMGAIAKLRSNQ